MRLGRGLAPRTHGLEAHDTSVSLMVGAAFVVRWLGGEDANREIGVPGSANLLIGKDGLDLHRDRDWPRSGKPGDGMV